MKKNRMMRLASILLVCVLLTTSVISGTFAKYTITGTAETDSARVAKWGVTITAATDKTTFSNAYATEDTDAIAASIANSVKGEGTAKVVAPGTTGTLAEVTIAGTPEVAVEVSYVAEVTLTGWTTDGTDVYCPLVFNVNGSEIKIDGTNTTTALLEEAIEKAIEDSTDMYAPNTNLATDTTDDVVVTWSWPFVGNDAKDTALGNKTGGEVPTVAISITTTVDQLN